MCYNKTKNVIWSIIFTTQLWSSFVTLIPLHSTMIDYQELYKSDKTVVV